MRSIRQIIAFSLLFHGTTQAAIYRCERAHQTVFSDTPCGDHARIVTVSPSQLGGRLDSGTDVTFWEPPASTDRKRPDTDCDAGYIQSTELRSLRVRHQVREGMSARQVRYVLGDPDQQDGQWWIYKHRGEETGRYLLRRGCLVRWR